MNQKNKDLPAWPIMPFKNDFGQMIFLTGMSKQEIVALEMFKIMLAKENEPDFVSDEDIIFMVRESYNIAETFCEFLENEGKKDSDSIIMPV